METMPPTVMKQLLESVTETELRPGYEGANIGTIIGFKHVNYLVEAAVLRHFDAAGVPVGALYEEHGLGFDVIELDTRLQTALLVDDVVTAQVRPDTADDSAEFGFRVTLTVVRDGESKKAVTSKVRAQLRSDARVTDPHPVPEAMLRFVVDRIGDPAVSELTDVAVAPGADPVIAQLTEGRNAYAWKYRIPYFYCHFFERMQMSGYLRQMEEVVDLFLADRGLSIKPLLDERNWIPAVTASRIRMLGETIMEEELYTVFTVQDVFKNLLYSARMDCYVVRDGALVHTATGTITHAYGVVENGRHGRLVTFDDRVRDALDGKAAEVG
ncbi:thioesterase [Micromonospora sp. DT201]|uniref:thioesterase n=1 Tax=Micromonospora sp. DT201 TaxID=3393442 RepID=UPI003CFB4065